MSNNPNRKRSLNKLNKFKSLLSKHLNDSWKRDVEIAREIGVSRVQISKWKDQSIDAYPSFENLNKIRSAIELDNASYKELLREYVYASVKKSKNTKKALMYLIANGIELSLGDPIIDQVANQATHKPPTDKLSVTLNVDDLKGFKRVFEVLNKAMI